MTGCGDILRPTNLVMLGGLTSQVRLDGRKKEIVTFKFVSDFVKKHRWTSAALAAVFVSLEMAGYYLAYHGGSLEADTDARVLDDVLGLCCLFLAAVILAALGLVKLITATMDAVIRSDDAASAKFNTQMSAALEPEERE